MPFNATTGHVYDEASINVAAPQASGVYGIYTDQAWIYVGESNDLRRRLLEHVRGDNPCITRAQATGFVFELSPSAARVARQNQLILELRPSCNQMLG